MIRNMLTSKETLDNYRYLKKQILKAVSEAQRLGEKAVSQGGPAADRVASSLTNNATFERIIEEKADLESVILEELDRLDEMHKTAETYIALADTAEGRVILTSFYIDCLTNQQIADALHYDKRTIKRIKREALLQINGKLSSTCHPLE